MKRVKKLVSRLSLLGLGTAMLLANVAFGASTKNKMDKTETTGKIRQGSVQQDSPSNYVSLKEFNTELKNKVEEYQLVAAFTSVENSKQSMTTKIDGSKSAISGSVNVNYAQSLIDHKDGTKQASETIQATLSAALSANYTLTGQISASQDLQDKESDQNNGVSDLSLIVSQKHIRLSDWLSGGFNISSVLPVSKYSQKYQNSQGSIGASYTFDLTDEVLAKGVTTALTLGASRNFHQYETDVTGRVLNPYGAKEALSAGYSIERFSFSFEFIHRHAWNYKGSVSESFEHSEEVGYSVTPKWGMALGHTNGGSWLAPNGRDSNLKLINEDDSIVYLSTSLMF